MDEDKKQKAEQSVANRVISTFVAAVEEDEELAEMAMRLREALLEADTVNEASLRQAIFGDDK